MRSAFLLVLLTLVFSCKPRSNAKNDAGAGSGAAATTPARARAALSCSWAAAAGLPATSTWRARAAGDGWGCNSLSKNFGEGTLAYYAKGTPDEVREVYFMLDVFGKQQDRASHAAIVEALRVVVRSAYGDTLHPKLEEMIEQGKAGQADTSGGHRATMTRTPHVNGRGYEYRVSLDVLVQ